MSWLIIRTDSPNEVAGRIILCAVFVAIEFIKVLPSGISAPPLVAVISVSLVTKPPAVTDVVVAIVLVVLIYPKPASMVPLAKAPTVVMLEVPAAATVVPPIVKASVSKVPSTSISPAKSILPGIVTTELAPSPTVTSTSLASLPPVNIRPSLLAPV